MMLTRGEFFAKLGELLDENDVRFSLGGEELEVERIDTEAEMEEAWIILAPKAETEAETGVWYVGRHRKNDK